MQWESDVLVEKAGTGTEFAACCSHVAALEWDVPTGHPPASIQIQNSNSILKFFWGGCQDRNIPAKADTLWALLFSPSPQRVPIPAMASAGVNSLPYGSSWKSSSKANKQLCFIQTRTRLGRANSAPPWTARLCISPAPPAEGSVAEPRAPGAQGKRSMQFGSPWALRKITY